MNRKPYVTVMPSGRRHGFMVANRDGCVVTHTHLGSGSPDEVRAKAAAMFPDHRVVLPDDEFKPWLHRDIGIAEHGSRKGTLFARCSCTWSGPPRRSVDKAAADLSAHINPEES